MTSFDGREKAFEDKFAHDEALLFKARARRNRLFAEWLAGEMALPEAALADYIQAVVKSDLEEAGDADILRKVRGDLEKAGLALSDHRLEKKLGEFWDMAKAQLMAED